MVCERHKFFTIYGIQHMSSLSRVMLMAILLKKPTTGSLADRWNGHVTSCRDSGKCCCSCWAPRLGDLTLCVRCRSFMCVPCYIELTFSFMGHIRLILNCSSSFMLSPSPCLIDCLDSAPSMNIENSILVKQSSLPQSSPEWEVCLSSRTSLMLSKSTDLMINRIYHINRLEQA